MRMRFVVCGWLSVVTTAAACGSSASAPPSVYNTWIYENGSSANGITFKTDHTYVSSVLQVVSTSALNLQEETGTFSVSGSTITFTPTNWTCPEPTDPTYTATYVQTGSLLEIAYSSGLISYQVDTAAPSSIGLAYGCFPESGGFIASPLAPVGSCIASGSPCTSASECCLGSACIDVNGGICAGTCTSDTDCMSGCCAAPGTVSCTQGPFGTCGYCAPSSACAPPDAG